MKFPSRYKIINTESYSDGAYSLIPIRYEDRNEIMKWRNEQIFHLRQKELLTKELQDKYFEEVISKLFEEDEPTQLLFSFLKDNVLIGYGGLVHIDWGNKNAEISFIMATELQEKYFKNTWIAYLNLLYKYAFEDLNLHKVYTYAFDVRPHLYGALEDGGLQFEARLKEQVFFEREFKDVIIHGKVNPIILDKNKFYLRIVNINDMETLYHWVNDSTVRSNSFDVNTVQLNDHINWFKSKLNSDNTKMFILQNLGINTPLGQIRLDYLKDENIWLLSYSLNRFYRGQGLGTIMLDLVKETSAKKKIRALVKSKNIGSIKALQKANFKLIENTNSDNDHLVYESIESL